MNDGTIWQIIVDTGECGTHMLKDDIRYIQFDIIHGDEISHIKNYILLHIGLYNHFWSKDIVDNDEQQSVKSGQTSGI
jgi:hypothetical protein